MLENIEHNVNHNVISKWIWILSHNSWIIGSYRANFSVRKILSPLFTSFSSFSWVSDRNMTKGVQHVLNFG